MSKPAFDPTGLPPSYFDERVAALDAEIASVDAELRRLSAEREWWMKGRALFASSTKGQQQADPESEVTELTPSDAVLDAPGTKPTIRQAVLRVLLNRASPNGREPEWRAGDVFAALEQRGWMPDSEKHAENIVRHMLRDLVKRGDLVKTGYGLYALAPQTRAAHEHPNFASRNGSDAGPPAGPSENGAGESPSTATRPQEGT